MAVNDAVPLAVDQCQRAVLSTYSRTLVPRMRIRDRPVTARQMPSRDRPARGEDWMVPSPAKYKTAATPALFHPTPRIVSCCGRNQLPYSRSWVIRRPFLG